MYKTYSEEVITVDVYNLCRICMLNHKNLAYFNIFGKCMPNNGPSLAAVLEQLTSIKVYKSLYLFHNIQPSFFIHFIFHKSQHYMF